MIWYKEYSIDDWHLNSKNTLTQHLGIELLEIGKDFIKGRMPVDNRTRQNAGILHGGASVALAETLGSVASSMVVVPDLFTVVGLEINANHIRSVSTGWVIGVAKPVHIGRSTHIWQIEIHNEEGKLICMSRLTMAVLKKNK